MPSVVHVLPHRGEGAETYLDVLATMDGWEQRRLSLAETRRPAHAALQIVRRLPAVAREARRATLIHVHGEVASLACLPIVRARPSVVTTHGLHLLRRTDGSRRRAAEGALRAIVAAADRTICVARSELEEAAAVLPRSSQDKLVAVPNGLSPPPLPAAGEREQARATLGFEEGAVAFLYVGQLEQRKDPLLAVRAAGAARDRGAPVELLLAGDGPLLEAARAQARPGVRVLGRRGDVGRLLVAADVFVLPSRREGLSYALLEAMARSLPPVVADAPGNVEGVGDAGVVLPAGDLDAFTETFVRLAGNPDERTRLGHLARQRVAESFAAEEMVARTRAVYEDVCAAWRLRHDH